MCHIDAASRQFDFGGRGNTEEFHTVGDIITVADPALPAHVGHGASVNFDVSALPDGTVLCVSNNDGNGNGLPDYAESCYTDGTTESSRLRAGFGDPVVVGGIPTGNTDRFSTTDCSEPFLAGTHITFRQNDTTAATDVEVCLETESALAGVGNYYQGAPVGSGPTQHHDPEQKKSVAPGDSLPAGSYHDFVTGIGNRQSVQSM